MSTVDPSLIDRWFAVYDRHMRPLGQPALDPIFSVPQTVAVWDQPALSSQEGREQMERMGSSKFDQFTATLHQGAATGHVPAPNTEGIYYSLPLDGRVDLMRPRPVKPRQPSPDPQPSLAASTQNLPDPTPVPIPNQQGSPPLTDTWNAQHHAPPRRSGPEFGEMRDGMPANYQNAWDKPLGHQKHEHDWDANEAYPSIPEVVKQDNWYAGAASGTPDYSKVETVFPWELKRHAPSRHFPASDPPPPRPSSHHSEPPALRLQLPSPPLGQPSSSPPAGHQRHESFSQSMAHYSNAWDIPSIQKYADHLVGVKDRRAAMMSLQTPKASPEMRNPLEQSGGLSRSPYSKRNRRESLGDRSDGSRDGDDEETTSDDERHAAREGPSRRSHHARGKTSPNPSPQKAAVGGGAGGGRPYQSRAAQTESGPPMKDRASQTPPLNVLDDKQYAQHQAGNRAHRYSLSPPSGGKPMKRQSSEETVTFDTLNMGGTAAATAVGSQASTPTQEGVTRGQWYEGSSNGSSPSQGGNGQARPASRVFDPSTSLDVSLFVIDTGYTFVADS